MFSSLKSPCDAIHAGQSIGAVFDVPDSISQAPRRWPKHLHGTRRFVLQRFPFSIVYLDEPDVLNVVAVAHNKPKPGYWKQRL